MSEENKKSLSQDEVSNETDAALDSFLTREQEQKPVKTKKTFSRILILIIAVVVVGALVALLIYLNNRTIPGEEIADESAALTLSVSDSGEHEAAVALDENGAIKKNGSGSLLAYYPSDIGRIDVENQNGSFSVTAETPEGEATIYTLVGFEGIELQEGIADSVANDAAAVDFISIVSGGDNAADFGMDAPRATVRVRFNDDTTATIRVGSDAPAEAGAYISFGSSDAVYLVSGEAVDSFLYSVNEFVSLEITASSPDVDSSEPIYLTVSGSHYPEPITIEPNKDEAINATYVVTSPVSMFANATESYDIAGAVRGLNAESVVCVNPTDSQLSSYGLSEPYAAIEASYPDTDITLYSSAPDDNAIVYIYNPDKDIVYTIEVGAVTWAKTGIDMLVPGSVIDAKLEAVSAVRFTAGDNDYDIKVTSAKEIVVNDDGEDEEQISTTASYDGKPLDDTYFTVFFQNCNAIRSKGTAEKAEGSEVMSFAFSYSTGRDDDVVKAYSTGGAQYVMTLNDTVIGTASKSYIDDLIDSANDLISGYPVTSL